MSRKSKLLTRAQINAACVRKSETVSVPEWGGPVRIIALSSAERDRWEELSGVKSGFLNMDHFRANLVALCLVNEDGAREYGDDEIEELGEQPAVIIDRLFRVAARLSGVGRWKDKPEEAAKNSEGTDGDGSSSGSLSPSGSQVPKNSKPH